MDTEGICVFLVLVIGAAFSLYLSVIALCGHFKAPYLFKGIPLMAPAGMIYTGFPAGIGALIYAIALLIPNIELGGMIVAANSFLMMLSALVLMIWKPRWLKPQWLRWLEDSYPYLLDTLLEEARKEGKTWEAKVHTQEGLEKWAEQTAARYGG